MMEPAVLETLRTAALVALVFGTGAVALIALPWSDHQILLTHRAAIALFSRKAVRA